MSKIKPLRNQVLIRRVESEKKTAGGIIIPDSVQEEKKTEGVVLAVGDGTKSDSGNLIPLSVKVGEKVLFEKWGATEIKVDGEELLLLEEGKILAIIED